MGFRGYIFGHPGGYQKVSKIFFGGNAMIRVLLFLMFFPIIIIVKIIGWVFSCIIEIFKLIALIDIFK